MTWLGDYGGWMWAVIDIVLVAILGSALIYGTMQWRKFKQTPRQQARRDQATRELFKE